MFKVKESSAPPLWTIAAIAYSASTVVFSFYELHYTLAAFKLV
jgi:hypothetical protein